MLANVVVDEQILSRNQRPPLVGMPRVALWRTVEAAFGLLFL